MTQTATVSNSDLLPRRLTAEGCQVAGTALEAVLKQMHADQLRLEPGVARPARGVVQLTAEIAGLLSRQGEGSMFDLDRSADSAIAALSDRLDGTERGAAGEDILPLTADEAAERDLARQLHDELFGQGTGFLRLPYRQQWAAMVQLSTRLKQPHIQSGLARLGLTLHAGRVARWTDLYGARLGLTESHESADPLARAVLRWHDAWGDLMVHVRASYSDAKDAELRAQLLRPYEDQAQHERAQETKERRRRPASQTTAPFGSPALPSAKP
jgi:hypothetical protein